MGGRYGNAKRGSGEERCRSSGFRAETLHRRETRNLGSHCLHDAPSTNERSQRHRDLTGNHNPERDVKLRAEMALRVKQDRDDAHGFLRIVSTVTERIERSRNELKMLQCTVDGERR